MPGGVMRIPAIGVARAGRPPPGRNRKFPNLPPTPQVTFLQQTDKSVLMAA